MINFLIGVIAGLAVGVYMPSAMPQVASLFAQAGKTISQSIHEHQTK